jgi:hypothetical protein
MTSHDDRDDPTRAGFGSGSNDENSGRSSTESDGQERCTGGTRRARHHRRHRRHGGRKERVLHTRISEQLSDDIRRLAEDLRVPTSNLVRNVLEEVFTMVESVSEDVGGIFEEVLDEAESARDRIRRQSARSRRPRTRHRTRDRVERPEGFDDSVEEELRRDEAREHVRQADPAPTESEPERRERPDFPEVLGWQPLVLNREQTCASCGVDLPRGTRAFVGLGEQGILGTTLCRACTGVR